MSYAATAPAAHRRLTWFKRIGLLGFTFFLIKGLIWLGVLAGAWHLSQ
jgi:hypothetical protein